MSDYIFHLVVRKGPRPGQIFPLTLESITIGRDPMSDIVVNDPELSRHHARLIYTGSGYQVQDMGSTNGTFVDGNRLAGETVSLSAGQTVALGSNVALLYQMAENSHDPMATMVAPMASTPPISLPDLTEETNSGLAGFSDMADPSPAKADESFDLPSFDAPAELPSFDDPMELPSFDDPAELPSFDAPSPSSSSSYEPMMSEPSFGSSAPDPVYDPSPLPAGGSTVEAKKNNTVRNIIIAVVAILLLCCCCLLVTYYGGDSVMRSLCNDPVAAADLADICVSYQ
jgi:pSer/pThr/pTyr-binding forkhead associated (FHA) protein